MHNSLTLRNQGDGQDKGKTQQKCKHNLQKISYWKTTIYSFLIRAWQEDFAQERSWNGLHELIINTYFRHDKANTRDCRSAYYVIVPNY